MALARSWLGMVLAASALAAQPVGRGLVVVLVGPTEAGKTTQAAFLKRKFGIPHIEVDRVRHQAPERVDAWVRERVRKADAKKGFVLDGYPSTRDEAALLSSLVKELSLPSPLVIELSVPDRVVRERAAKRGTAADKPEIVDALLADYHREAAFCRANYPQADVWTIDGTRAPEDVSKTIETLMADRSLGPKAR